MDEQDEHKEPAVPPAGEHEAHDPDGRIEHPLVDYERSDVSFRRVLIVALACSAIGAAMIFGVYTFFHSRESALQARRASDFPLAEHPSVALPASPRLEQLARLPPASQKAAARENVYVQEGAKEETLNSLGSTPEKGFVHIPIARAIELTAGHLPVRKSPPAPSRKDNGLVDGGESNSGRLLRGEPK